jgi:hypothetical protein
MTGIIVAIRRETKRTVTGPGDERWVEVCDKIVFESDSHALRLQRIDESTNIHVSPTNTLSLASQNIPALLPTAGLPQSSGAVGSSIPFHQLPLPSIPSLLAAADRTRGITSWFAADGRRIYFVR